MTDYGKRGGTGFTSGKKAEIITDANGWHRKRVFKGQRVLVVAQFDEHAKQDVYALGTKKRADEHVEMYLDDGYMVAYAVDAQPVA